MLELVVFWNVPFYPLTKEMWFFMRPEWVGAGGRLKTNSCVEFRTTKVGQQNLKVWFLTLPNSSETKVNRNQLNEM